MASGSGFDMSKMSTASKILLGGGVLYLIDTFLPWQRACADTGVFGKFCVSQSGMSGLGIINLLLALAIIVWEALSLAGVDIKAPKGQVAAGLAGGLVVFTLLKILVDHEAIAPFAFVGIILALVIGYGGWMKFQEPAAGGSASSGSAEGGGFSS